LDVTQKQRIDQQLREVFRGWGYHQIITSTLERLETLMAGGAIEPNSVLQLQGVDDGKLGLRPELTASIARAAATRLGTSIPPLRLYYHANVFRQQNQGGHAIPQELYQAGVELLGTEGTIADGEVLLLLVDCLNSLGLNGLPTPQGWVSCTPPWFLVLGEAGLTASLLQPFPEAVRPQVLQAIAHLDRIALETLGLPSPLRDQALFLFDLRGKPETVLAQVSQLDLNDDQWQRVQNLKDLVDLFNRSLAQQFPALAANSPLILDLSLVQTFDYYTGIIFEVVQKNPLGQWLLGQGGRYDQLLGLYHPDGTTSPGIGFSLNIETLQQVLIAAAQLPEVTTPSDWLVVAQTMQAQADAFAYAQKLRNTSEMVRVELYLGLETEMEPIRHYAQERRINRIAWIRSETLPEIEVVR
jgi:ATP phosphoribosyltransferase regulatory subunit